MTAEVIMDRRVTVSAPGATTDFVDWSRLLLSLALRTPVHEGLGYRGFRDERTFPNRIQGDAVFSACVVYGPGQDHELPSIARLQGVPPIPLLRGAQHKQPKPNVCGLGRKEVFKACGNLQWNNFIYRLWLMPSAQTPTSTARRRLLFHR
jgi:hypothetical protein